MDQLKLSEEYRHFNSLIWQVPSWGIAIAAGVIVAADRLEREDQSKCLTQVKCVQVCILFFGAVLLSALAIALYRYRAYQAAAVPYPVPKPPFGSKLPANTFLQLAICLTAGGVFGLTLAKIAEIFVYDWFT